MPRRFVGHTKEEDLPWLVSLPDFKVFEGGAAGKRVMRCPINTTAIHPDAQIRFDVVRGNSPILGQLWKTITPVFLARNGDVGGNGFV